VNWSKIPDAAAVILLASAFASVARHRRAPISVLWLIGWLMIALHFVAFIFLQVTAPVGTIATFFYIAALAWAGILFNWASAPDRDQQSSVWMLVLMLGTNTLYISLLLFVPGITWAMALAASMFGVSLLVLALFNTSTGNHPLHWVTVGLYCGLSVFLLSFQDKPHIGHELALNAVLFTIYLGCSIYFSYDYRRATSGAVITIVGFFAWTSVFVVAPAIAAWLPHVHIEDGVWNLPKYIVASGMMLLLLEDQIEHNKYLALHDELTGLPNRRLFQDRLANALERARRTGTQTALLLVDLDQFKEVNDTFGHHAGDRLLVHVGELFSGRVRRSDTVARTGGDEFTIILDEPISRADAEHVAHSLIHLLQEPYEWDGQNIYVGASIGVAVFPHDGVTAEDLCIAADLRMYDSKKRNPRMLSFENRRAAIPCPQVDLPSGL
jgi:diguanylate cyclase